MESDCFYRVELDVCCVKYDVDVFVVEINVIYFRVE